jgi:hypothetical protein
MLYTCLSACSFRVQTPISPISSISPLEISPLVVPTTTLDEKEVSIVLTAQTFPTLEPTPTTPADAQLCSAANLTPGEGSMGGATQHDFLYLPVTNTSQIGCVLQPPAKVQLVNAQGMTLPVDYSPPPETATSPTGEPLKLYIRPGEVAMFVFDWGNWCTPLKHPQLMARVNLNGDNTSLNIPIGFLASFPFFYGHCFSPNARSTLFTMFVTRIPK